MTPGRQSPTDDAGGNGRGEVAHYTPREAVPDLRALDRSPEEGVHLRDYLNLILRRRLVVAAFFIIVVTTVAVFSFMATPLYKATATVRIDSDNPNILNFKDIYQADYTEASYYQTQYRILKSRSVAERVIEKLDLANNEEFGGQGRGRLWLAWLNGASGDGKQKDDSPEAAKKEAGVARAEVVNRFLERVEVSPLQKSRLVNVSFTSRNPRLAMDAANALADSFIEFNIDSKFEAGQKAREWLQEQIEIMKAKVEASEERLNEYSAGNEMIFVEDEEKRRQSLQDRELAFVSEALNDATAERIGKEALFRQIQEAGPDNPVVLNSELIQNLKKEYAALESEYFNLLKLYKPEYPAMKRLKGQMEAVSESIEKEKKRIVKSVESDFLAALKRERELMKAFESQKREAIDFQRKTVQYQILKREADTNNELYNSLLQRLKEIGVSATMTATNIQVLDRAELPVKPHSPKKAKNMLVAILVGLMGGIGMAFFTEYLDNTVKDPSEIEKRMNMPALGLIPLQKAADPAGLSVIAHTEAKSPLAEAFRSIGTFILFSSASRPPKVILITSPREKEGKTTLSTNTSIILTRQLGRGLIIDADLRNPNVHRRFDLENSIGLSTYLSGNIDSYEGLIRQTRIEGLDVITAGPVPPNPSELLGSARMSGLISGLESVYDFIIMDSPPVLGMTDSLYLSAFADGVILVVKSGQTQRTAVLETKKVFGYVNAKILGVVLNGIREGESGYKYYSYYYSGYYGGNGS